MFWCQIFQIKYNRQTCFYLSRSHVGVPISVTSYNNRFHPKALDSIVGCLKSLNHSWDVSASCEIIPASWRGLCFTCSLLKWYILQKSCSLVSLVAKWLMWLDLLVFTSQRCPHLFHRDKSSYSSAIHFCTHQWLRFIDLKTIKRSKSISQHVNIRVLCLHTHCQISPIKTKAYNEIVQQW